VSILKRGGYIMKAQKKFVFIGLFIAIDILLTYVFSIQTPIIRISFGFIPVALSAMLFGPVLGGITGALSDILGMLIFPKGAYFPGFTVSAFLSGFIYGIFLYKKHVSVIRISIASIINIVLIDMVLNSLWLSILMAKGFLGILLPRIIKSLIMFPIQVFLIYTVCAALLYRTKVFDLNK
jgi:ECF transporter S component (folate family)